MGTPSERKTEQHEQGHKQVLADIDRFFSCHSKRISEIQGTFSGCRELRLFHASGTGRSDFVLQYL